MDRANLVTDGIELIAQWRTVGTLAGILAAVHLVIRLSKTAQGQALLAHVSGPRPWLRPLVAAGLGALAGAVGALVAGQGLAGALGAALTGIIAGFGASGAHEAAGALTRNGRAEAQAKRAVKALVDNGDGAVHERAAALKRELDTIAALTDRRSRLLAQLPCRARLRRPERDRSDGRP